MLWGWMTSIMMRVRRESTKNCPLTSVCTDCGQKRLRLHTHKKWDREGDRKPRSFGSLWEQVWFRCRLLRGACPDYSVGHDNPHNPKHSWSAWIYYMLSVAFHLLINYVIFSIFIALSSLGYKFHEGEGFVCFVFNVSSVTREALGHSRWCLSEWVSKWVSEWVKLGFICKVEICLSDSVVSSLILDPALKKHLNMIDIVVIIIININNYSLVDNKYQNM